MNEPHSPVAMSGCQESSSSQELCEAPCLEAKSECFNGGSMSRVYELVSKIKLILFPRQNFPASHFFVMKQSTHSIDLENFGNQVLS